MTELDEKLDLIKKVERISSAEEVQKLKVFIAGMEAGKAAWELESKKQYPKRNIL